MSLEKDKKEKAQRGEVNYPKSQGSGLEEFTILCIISGISLPGAT
jgi:hypothetical protein